MNNFVIKLKRFITNKNVITILGILVALGLLYWGYSSTIKKATNPVNVPVAAKTIGAQTEITSEDVTYINVAGSMVGDGVVRNASQIVGMYTNLNVTIPEGSMFYSSWLVTADNLPGNWIEQLDYEKGELGYYMNTDVVKTLGNSVLPNTYVDIYMKAPDENGTIMFGKLLSNVKIMVVHDGSGKNIFADASNIGTPSYLGFAVSQDLYTLLKKSETLTDIELVIAPRGETVPKKDYIIVRSATLRDYIDSKTITVEEDEIEEEVQEDTETTEDTENTTDENVNNQEGNN